jgi:hypothetical protein
MQRSQMSACAVTMLCTDASHIDGQRLHSAERSQRWTTSAAGWALHSDAYVHAVVVYARLHYIPGALTCILQPRAQDRTAACKALQCDNQHAGPSYVAEDNQACFLLLDFVSCVVPKPSKPKAFCHIVGGGRGASGGFSAGSQAVGCRLNIHDGGHHL